ncbi:hypothetical protein EHQ82_16895 [Leptospira selangorensis]|uniref:Uncharacterized protein n=1 Tax=Leptospira selangorensis TaxID=2484982 RepID=A0ABY2N4C7_9LEPT|nr:hypothetical protein [Leptospira selangorensis]TGM16779.1 hypothetical protein EHQ82_16895 [Leptospira selangorensis]
MNNEIDTFVKKLKTSINILKTIDPDDQRTMTYNLFNSLTKEQKEALADTSSENWSDFKSKFREYQLSLGFQWTPYQAFAGPLSLDKVFVPDTVLVNLANKYLSSKLKEGTLDSIINENFSEYFSFGISPDLASARRIFSDVDDGTQKFTFITNSNNFKLVTKSYEFPGLSKKSKNKSQENDFCTLIEPILKSRFMNANLRYTQNERQQDKYQNIDFAGYIINDKITNTSIEVIAIEAKPSNSFEKVSEAIRQSINYKQIANIVYILLPMFDSQSFHDLERFEDYRAQCQSHGIGIISVDMDPKDHKPKNVQIVLEPNSFEINKMTLLRNLLDEDLKSLCPLCRKIVGLNNSNCGWQISGPDNEAENILLCMRERLEYSAILEYKQSKLK